MFSTLKRLLRNEEYRRLFENFFSLSLLNAINYLFPLILIPYLTRILGVEKFGLYAFSFAVIQYCTILVNYGFDFSATKKIAIYRDNIEKISEVFISVIVVRFAIALFCFILISISVGFITMLRNEYLLYLYGIGIFFGQALTPIWLFQGMEQMRFVTIINFVSKLTSTVLIFIFLKHQSDYIYVNLYFSAGYLLAGVLSIFLAIKIFRIKSILPRASIIIEQIKEGWHLFLSTVFMSFYRESNIIILGSLTNYTVVGYYSVAEKIVKAVQSIISPVSAALYPYFGRNLNLDSKRTESLARFFNVLRYYTLALIIMVFLLFILSGFIVTFYLGVDFTNSILNLRIMSLVVLFGGLNYILGIVGLVNLGFEKQFTIAVFISGTISILTCFLLVHFFSDRGAAIAMVLSECVLLFLILSNYRSLNLFKLD